MNHANIERVKSFFDQRLSQHGDNHLAVDWGSREGQFSRFDALRKITPLYGQSLLDVGCGLGHLVDWLVEHEIKTEHYEGIDVTYSMIEAARQRHPGMLFQERDLLAGDLPSRQSYNVVFASGIFYLAVDEPYVFISNLLDRLFSLANQVLVFNIPTYSEIAQPSGEFRAEASKILEIISSLSPYYCVDHSYHQSDMTLAIYRGID